MHDPHARTELIERVKRLPTGPGVYRWRDATGRVLYVGKAANLRGRARSYLREGGDGRLLVRLLMRRATDVDAISTNTPEEALLLENTLIKQEKPPYNLRLKDDKSYLLVRVDRTHAFPRLRLVRKIKRDGAQYFGPFASAKGVRRTLRFLRTMYPLRTCSDRELEERTRPCLYYQIGRCAAPCVDKISTEDYARMVDGALALLRGNDPKLVRRLRADMEAASERQEYERAAIFRDRMHAVEAALAQQEAVSPDGKDRDVVAVASAGGVAMIGVVYVRDGHVVAARAWPQRTRLSRRDVLHAFVSQFYLRGKVIPAEVLVQEEPDDVDGLQELLAELRGAPVRVRVPKRGAGNDLMEMAARNAEEALQEHSERARNARAALERIQTLLDLPAVPERIEGFDLSHLGGEEPVAGMSVLVGGVADSSHYRHFAVKRRRGGRRLCRDGRGRLASFRRGHGPGGAARPRVDRWRPRPGRSRQAGAGRARCVDDIPLVGLAKARTKKGDERTDERLVRLDLVEPIVLEPDDPALRILVKARDEAHRFAGRYQKKRRARAFGHGALDGIPGVGPSRKKRLLKQFGSVEALRNAPFEDLAAVPGIGQRLARLIRERLA